MGVSRGEEGCALGVCLLMANGMEIGKGGAEIERNGDVRMNCVIIWQPSSHVCGNVLAPCVLLQVYNSATIESDGARVRGRRGGGERKEEAAEEELEGKHCGLGVWRGMFIWYENRKRRSFGMRTEKGGQEGCKSGIWWKGRGGQERIDG
jgi:hypothetical protein